MPPNLWGVMWVSIRFTSQVWGLGECWTVSTGEKRASGEICTLINTSAIVQWHVMYIKRK